MPIPDFGGVCIRCIGRTAPGGVSQVPRGIGAFVHGCRVLVYRRVAIGLR